MYRTSYLLAALLFLVFATNKVFAKEDGLTYCMGEAVEDSEVGGLVDVARARNGLSAPWSQWIAQAMDARGIAPVELSDKGCDIMILSAHISADALAERESGTKNLARIVFDSDLETNTEASTIIAENLERVLPSPRFQMLLIERPVAPMPLGLLHCCCHRVSFHLRELTCSLLP